MKGSAEKADDNKNQLEIKAYMNSSCNEVLGFKTCCGLKMADQNLEIHVKNVGRTVAMVPSYCDLVGDRETNRIENLLPHGEHAIQPGEIMAFYCYMDEVQWNAARELAFFDRQGNRYSMAIEHGVL